MDVSSAYAFLQSYFVTNKNKDYANVKVVNS